MSSKTNEEWTRLNISKGELSYGQERIWLDESIRLSLVGNDENLHLYNSIILYQIVDGIVSINRFRRSIQDVINKHEIFRTSLEYSPEEHSVKQIINQSSSNENHSFELTYFDIEDKEKMKEIYNEEISKEHINLNEGKLFRCHLLKQSDKDKNRLNKNDFIVFIFHHSAIDQYSKYLFFKELTFAYQNQKLDIQNNQFRFIDYSQYERQLDMNKCEEFWQNLFSDYNFDQRLNLPYDTKLTIKSSGSFYSFEIDPSLTRQIFRYKQKMNITLFRLFLSTFYIYLFKLAQEKDICITGTTPNRYRTELNHLIGPLENLIVYRFQLDPQKSFNQVLKQVEQLCLDIKENAYYPYQKFIAYARKFSSVQYPFSQVSLRLDIDDDQWNLDPKNNLILNQISLNQFKRDTQLTPVDLTLNIKCNLEKKTIQFCFNYANKLFEEETIQTLAQRFQKLLKHLFDVSSNFDLDEEPVYKLSIILPREERLIDKLNSNNN